MPALESLLARIEAAHGPDRNIDYDVAKAFGKMYRAMTEEEKSTFWIENEYGAYYPGIPVVPLEYSKSIDAVLTLVDVSKTGIYLETHEDCRSEAYVASLGELQWAVAATPALALLAAAVRDAITHLSETSTPPANSPD